jgi:hypothetical protein
MSRLGLLLVPLTLVAAPVTPEREAVPFGQGMHVFRALLKARQIEPLESFDRLFDQPDGNVLVILGDTEKLEPYWRRVDQFLRAGGSVLIATDRRTSNELFNTLGVRVSGQFVRALAPNLAYRGELMDCPLVQPPMASLLGRRVSFPTFLFQGLGDEPVATNRPSYLAQMAGVTPVATMPSARPGWIVPGPLGTKATLENQDIFAVVGDSQDWPKGHLLVMADHSVFINDMLLQKDNGNWKFADNAVSWLTDNDQRKHVLFYEDGDIRKDFNAGLQIPVPHLPPMEVLVPMANQLLAGLERENAFNHLLVQAFGNLSAVVRTTLLVLTFALLIYGLYRVLNARHRVEAKVPRLPAQLTALATPLPAQEMRHQAMLARGNLSEAARELTRQAFTALGVPPTAGTAAPDFTVDGSWWQRRVWGRRVRQLWELTALGHGRRVSPRDLERMAADLHALRAAAAGGKLHFAAAK